MNKDILTKFQDHFLSIKFLDEFVSSNYMHKSILLFYPNYITTFDSNITVVEHSFFVNEIRDKAEQIISCDNLPYDILNKIPIHNYDIIIFNRIIEHIKYDDVSYLVYCLYHLLKKNGLIFVTYPDMYEIVKVLRSNSNNFDSNYIKYYNIELFNEGDYNSIHKLYTDENYVKHYFTNEDLFSWEFTSELFSISSPRKIYRCSIFRSKER